MSWIPEFKDEAALNGFLVANLGKLVFLAIGAFSALSYAIASHDRLDFHEGMPEQAQNQITASNLENNVYQWYSDLSGIARRQELGNVTNQDAIDSAVYSNLMITACRQLRDLENDACDSLLMEY